MALYDINFDFDMQIKKCQRKNTCMCTVKRKDKGNRG